MKTPVFFLSAALLALHTLNAQQICKRSSVFFDKDQSDLTAPAIKKLDSILTYAAQNHILAELYGHADTTGSNGYNYDLAMRRMKAIEAYLDANAKNHFTYKEKNFSETNTKVSGNTDANLAYNRRVDIYLIPLQNGMLQLSSGKNETVMVPVDYFEPCGLCGNQPTITSYYDPKDTKNTNLTFETSDGYNLATAGTTILDYTPCNGVRRKDTASVVFRICDGKPDQKMSLWQADTVNGKILWKPSKNKFVLNPSCGCYEYRAPAGQWCNLDKIIFDTIFRVVLPPTFAYQHTIVTDARKAIVYNSKDDSIGIKKSDTSCIVHGFAKSGNQVFLLITRIGALPVTRRQDKRNITSAYHSQTTMYRPLTYTDTTLNIRTAKFARTVTFGFYLPEYKEFIPMDNPTGKFIGGKKPDCSYQYGYIKGKTLYVINTKKVKTKYSNGGDNARIKFKRKTKKNFRRVSDYKVK